ncbi:MAG: hypothetical protein KGL39_44430 [Patescibacteria group bacterium]|nr:hypothetical protein [Patescibacteria group bacterium]
MMEAKTKKELWIGGAVVAGGVLLYWIHVRSAAAATSGGSGAAAAAAAAQQQADQQQALQTEALLASSLGTGASYSAAPAIDLGAGSLGNPSFAADLEQSLQVLQQAGILPQPPASGGSTSGQGGGSSPVAVIGSPRHTVSPGSPLPPSGISGGTSVTDYYPLRVKLPLE